MRLIQSGTFRVDHNFSASDSGYARFNVADAHFENRAAGALTAVSRGRTINTFTDGLLLSETHFFKPTTINEVKAQYSYLNNDVIPNEPIGPEINIDGRSTSGATFSCRRSPSNAVMNSAITYRWSAARHT